ncbi:DNA-binding protein [Roseococcus sp. SYP-B2431]|nr:DNA-binding protein [Roseococcus sp. SYP-B2431]
MLAERQHVSLRTLERWRGDGSGPRFLRVGPRKVIYPIAEVERWEAERMYASRAAELSGRSRAA